MAKTISNILEAMAKENKMGCTDAAVFGGFSLFVSQAAASLGELAGQDEREKFSRLAELADDYRQQSPHRRREILAQMKTLISGIAQADLPQTKTAAAKIQPLTRLDTAVQFLPNVGPKRAELFRRIGVRTVEDLLAHYPQRYEDWRNLVPIAQLLADCQEMGQQPADQTVTIRGRLMEWAAQKSRTGLSIHKASIDDQSGIITAVWFNQPYITKQLLPGTQIVSHGKLEVKYHQPQILVQDYEIVEAGDPARIVPVYSSTERLTQKVIRKAMGTAFDQYAPLVSESLPAEILKKYRLLPKKAALKGMHFPQSMEEQQAAHYRFAFEEFLLLQLGVLGNGHREKTGGIPHARDPQIWADFQKALSFPLTVAQQRAAGEIFRDMEAVQPMARLIQGDVGSGKTAVAAAALLKTVRSGYQGAMMAPTEILAAQHLASLEELLGPLGVRVALLTGRTPAKERAAIQRQLDLGEVDILVGTHALIQDVVSFRALGLAVTDEQHRFGVMQRAALGNKGRRPDVLVMTATPIPRTLALTLYGDLDLSVIDEMPPGRKEIKTYAVNFDLEERVFTFIKKEILAGRQAFVVCPLVEESEKIDLQAATELAVLMTREFSDNRVALLHGRMKAAEKEMVMADFRSGAIQLLVSTTVIEVGINIPNASVMLVRDAQRFGLAQLHQLRGRIGRGSSQSYCILMHQAHSPVARERMKIMAETNNGFKIAEADLTLRGPGEFFGTRQHGLPELKVANIFTDAPLLELARQAAEEILAVDPGLSQPEFLALGELVREKFRLLN